MRAVRARGAGRRAGRADARSCARCSRAGVLRKASLSGDAVADPRRAARAEGQRRRPVDGPRLPGADHRPRAARRAQHQVGRRRSSSRHERYGLAAPARPPRAAAGRAPGRWSRCSSVSSAKASMGDRDLAAGRRDPPRPPAPARCTRALDRVAQRALRGTTVNYVRVPAGLSLLLLAGVLEHDHRQGRGRLPRASAAARSTATRRAGCSSPPRCSRRPAVIYLVRRRSAGRDPRDP